MAGDDRTPDHAGNPMESSVELLELARRGDRGALDRLCARYLPRLRRWASGRLPNRARGLLDTDDLVQDTVLRTLDRIDDFQNRGEGALQAYMRQAVLNRIRDEVRRATRAPGPDEIWHSDHDRTPSPLDETIGREMVGRYESALARLGEVEREAVIARIEMGCSYGHIAVALSKSSADAARMTVSRALVKLAREMRE